MAKAFSAGNKYHIHVFHGSSGVGAGGGGPDADVCRVDIYPQSGEEFTVEVVDYSCSWLEGSMDCDPADDPR